MKNLTDRELQVLSLAAQGKTNREIGDDLYISIHTVKANLENLYEKFEVHNRMSLIIKAIKLNMKDVI